MKGFSNTGNFIHKLALDFSINKKIEVECAMYATEGFKAAFYVVQCL